MILAYTCASWNVTSCPAYSNNVFSFLLLHPVNKERVNARTAVKHSNFFANFFISFSPSYYDYIRLMSGDIIAQTYRIINELSEFTQCSIFSNCFTLYSSNTTGIFSTSTAASGFISNETFSPFCFTSVI